MNATTQTPISRAAAAGIVDEGGDRLIRGVLQLAPVRSAWGAIVAQCPSLFTAFEQHPELAAVDIGFMNVDAGGVARNTHGVPNAWIQDAGNLLPYIPDVTSSRDLAQSLWNLGAEMQPLAMTADLDPVLLSGARRQSMILLREFAVVRNLEVLDAAASAWDVDPKALSGLIGGFCDLPETGHGRISLRRRVEATAELYGRILSSETGITFEISGVAVSAPA